MEEYFLSKKYIKEDIENYIDLNQKKNFANFLEFICQSKKINISEQYIILETLREKLIIYLLNNREYLDEYIIANLVTYQNIIKDLITNEKSLLDFIKLINFIKVFTLNINMTSQVMSNCMNILNNTIEEFINKSNDKYKIDESNIFPILKLIELKLDLSININLYNPRLIIFISRVLTYLIQNKNNNNNNKINNISKFYPDINTKKFNIEKFIIEKSEETINKLVGNTKNDINYEIIFKIYVIINTNDIFKNNFSKFIFQIIIIKAIKIFRKKIHMNYSVITKKDIQFLLPYYDLSFLEDFPQCVNIEEKK